MHKNIARAALLTSVAALAYAESGWKLDADGKIAVDNDGNPIWVNSNGDEGSIKGDTISNLNREARDLRTQRDNTQKELDKFKGSDGKLIDPAAAIKAIDTVGKIDAKALIDAGEVDKVREQVRAEFTGQVNELTGDRDTWKTKYEGKLVDDVFTGEFMERVAIPRDFFAANMRGNFKVEDGKIVAYGRDGNRLMSKKNVGDFADASEALELLVEQHPQKDMLLKPDVGGGSGNNGGGGGRGQGRRMTRAEFSGLNPAQKAEAAAKQTSGELTITD